MTKACLTVGDLAEGVQDVVFGREGGCGGWKGGGGDRGGRYRGEGACPALNMAFEHNLKSLERIRT